MQHGGGSKQKTLGGLLRRQATWAEALSSFSPEDNRYLTVSDWTDRRFGVPEPEQHAEAKAEEDMTVAYVSSGDEIEGPAAGSVKLQRGASSSSLFNEAMVTPQPAKKKAKSTHTPEDASGGAPSEAGTALPGATGTMTGAPLMKLERLVTSLGQGFETK